MPNEDDSTLEGAMEAVVNRILNNSVSVSFPASITKISTSLVNPNLKIVDVAPNLMDIDAETGLPIPDEILSIPLVFANQTNTFMIRPPLDELSLIGAGVLCVVSDRYLANWKQTGGVVTAKDARMFDKCDAVAILGLRPDLLAWPFPAKANTAQIKTLPGTFIEIGNSTADIPRLLADLMDILLTATSLDTSDAGAFQVPLTFSPSTISGNTLAQVIAGMATIFNPDPSP